MAKKQERKEEKMITSYKKIFDKLQTVSKDHPQRGRFEGMNIEAIDANHIRVTHDYTGSYPCKAVWECESDIEKLLNKYSNIAYRHGGYETGTIVTILKQN